MANNALTPGRAAQLLTVALTAPLGDTLLAAGMRHVPPVSLTHPLGIVAAVLNPLVASGIALLIGFFVSYTSALAWADLTFVLPVTSVGNVLIAVLSRFVLHEQISPSRWLGILLITAGVGFVAGGEPSTERPPAFPRNEAPVPRSAKAHD